MTPDTPVTAPEIMPPDLPEPDIDPGSTPPEMPQQEPDGGDQTEA